MENLNEKKFDEEVFNNEFDELFKKWKENWVSEENGPFKVNILFKPLMTDEQKKAEEPEQEAHKNLIEYTATTIAIAHEYGKGSEIVKQIYANVFFCLTRHNLEGEFMKDVFARTMGLLQENKKENVKENNLVGEIINNQRKKFSKYYDFGYKL